MPVHHSPKGRQKGKGKAGLAGVSKTQDLLGVLETPNKSCVVDSGGNIVITVDMKSTDHTVE